ncbi:hypothetical protein DMP17_21985 [Pseudonocardia sp. TMWB2A]|uniref:hypothetical protein n=1 Tax=Pseudonocardia sp. TMWB2A TaxID=687430 RepID=UPI00307E6AD2
MITVDTPVLVRLLVDVREAASKDRSLPFLAGVALIVAERDDRHVLVATATDRFMALQGSVPVVADGQLGQRLFLSHQQLAQLLAALRPHTARSLNSVAQTTITVEDGQVTFSQASLGDLASVSVQFAHNAADGFPDIGKVMAQCLIKDVAAEPVFVAASKLVVFARIAARRGVSLSFRSTGTKQAVVLGIGNLVGILMPREPGTDETVLPDDMTIYPTVSVLEAEQPVGAAS